MQKQSSHTEEKCIPFVLTWKRKRGACSSSLENIAGCCASTSSTYPFELPEAAQFPVCFPSIVFVTPAVTMEWRRCAYILMWRWMASLNPKTLKLFLPIRLRTNSCANSYRHSLDAERKNGCYAKSSSALRLFTISSTQTLLVHKEPIASQI